MVQQPYNNENEHIPFWELKENIELYWTFAVLSQTQSNKTCTHVSGKAVMVLFWAEDEYMLTAVSLLEKQAGSVVMFSKTNYSRSIKVKQHTAKSFFFFFF